MAARKLKVMGGGFTPPLNRRPRPKPGQSINPYKELDVINLNNLHSMATQLGLTVKVSPAVDSRGDQYYFEYVLKGKATNGGGAAGIVAAYEWLRGFQAGASVQRRIHETYPDVK